ncbi:MAG: TetR/AcrR family transcriptional regulator [Pseudomonadales bacterium]|nr:TetR/AcrR family transcriptional regulator [Pseudomonadales bacterium]
MKPNTPNNPDKEVNNGKKADKTTTKSKPASSTKTKPTSKPKKNLDSNTTQRKTTDRAGREYALEQKALELLRKNGVLAGLNLREVADQADVNRGLVYHYFGSRQELLRAALKRDVKQRLSEIQATGKLPFKARIQQMTRTMLAHDESIQLATLLLLDGIDKPSIAPLHDHWISGFESDKELELIEDDTDLDGLLALTTALSYGYIIFRQAISEEFKIPLSDLDYRVDAVLEKMLSVFETEPEEK